MTNASATEYNCGTAELTAGTLLPNGETVVASRKLLDYRLCEDGFYNYGMWHFVAVRPGHNYHDYVVRTVSALPHGWSVSNGEYCHDIYKALTLIGMENKNG